MTISPFFSELSSLISLYHRSLTLTLSLSLSLSQFSLPHSGARFSLRSGSGSSFSLFGAPLSDLGNFDSRLMSNADQSASRKRVAAVAFERQQRIDEGVNTLQKLFPHSGKKGDDVFAMDHILEQIKSLKLQVKDLSRSTLRDDSSTEHLDIVHEGCGHITSQEMLNEHLGKLLQDNPSDMYKLLEGKSLFSMPIETFLPLEKREK